MTSEPQYAELTVEHTGEPMVWVSVLATLGFALMTVLALVCDWPEALRAFGVLTVAAAISIIPAVLDARLPYPELREVIEDGDYR